MGGNDFNLIFGFAGKSPLLDVVGIFFATYFAYLLGLIFVALLLAQKDWRRRLHLIFFSALSLLVSDGIIKELLNYFFYRPRPFVALQITPLITHAADASFPSGHATFFFTVATLIFFWINRRWGVWFFIAAIIMGVARVFVGVHYPLDILAGAAIGFISPLLLKWVLPPTVVPAIVGKQAPPHQGL